MPRIAMPRMLTELFKTEERARAQR